MAATYNSYTATGSTNVFPVTFPQYEYTSLLVTVNGIETTGYTYNSVSALLTINTPALVAGDTIIIRRVTDLDILYKFAQGAGFTGAHIDADIQQAFHAVEEARDYSGLIGYSLGDDLNARDHKIYNLADGEDPQDAVNVRQLDASAAEQIAYIDNQLLRTVRVPQPYTLTSLQAPLSLRGKILYFDSVSGQPAPALPGTIEEADFLKLQDYDGKKYIGQCPDFNSLRAVTPTYAGQRITLREYTVGTGYGGGEFKAVQSDLTDDGGYTAKVSTTWAWVRDLDDVADLNIVHFGAVPDMTTDSAPAVARMYAWAQSRTDWALNVGVQWPAGGFAMSTVDVSGTYVRYLRLAGPQVNFGYLSQTYIKLIGATGSIAFHANARWVDIHGLTIYGQGDTAPTVIRHFFRNEVKGGAYWHGSCFRALYVTGITFFMYDTIDWKADEWYASYCADSVLCAWPSGQSSGTWDHITACEVTNFNVQYHQADAAGKDAIFLPRAGQSIIHNGWIEHSAYPANISEGTWIIDQLSLEGNSQPVYAQYSKTHERHINVQGGSAGTYGIDHTQGAVGDLNGITRPSWVTSAYEQGYTKQAPQGFEIHGSFAYEFMNSANRFSNMTAATAWCRVGSIRFPAVGASAVIRLVGTGGFNSASTTARPGGTNYGGGEAYIRLQHKDDDTKVTVSWHGEGASPILQVRYVNLSSASVDIYVQVRSYTYAIAAMLDTDSTSRLQAGVRFYWLPDMSAVDNIDSVTTTIAPPVLGFSNGTNGFGMGFDSGLFAMDTPLSTVASSTWLPLQLNGNTYYVQVSGTAGRPRIPSYAMSALPAASADIRTMYAWCTGMTASPTAAPVYCDGSNWRRFSDDSVVS